MANVMANKEQVSALVDGEIQDTVLLEQLSADAELADTFARYHLYGDALRNELPAYLALDLSDQIAAALMDEAPILAVASTADATPGGEASNLNAGQHSHGNNIIRPRFGRLTPVLRYAGQFAIAASVSAALIVGVQQYSQQGLQSPVLNTVPMSGGVAPVSLNYPQKPHQPSDEQVLLEQQRRIHELLMDHELQQRLRQN